MIPRRDLLVGALATLFVASAPAIVRSSSLMKVKYVPFVEQRAVWRIRELCVGGWKHYDAHFAEDGTVLETQPVFYTDFNDKPAGELISWPSQGRPVYDLDIASYKKAGGVTLGELWNDR